MDGLQVASYSAQVLSLLVFPRVEIIVPALWHLPILPRCTQVLTFDALDTYFRKYIHTLCTT